MIYVRRYRYTQAQYYSQGTCVKSMTALQKNYWHLQLNAMLDHYKPSEVGWTLTVTRLLQNFSECRRSSLYNIKYKIFFARLKQKDTSYWNFNINIYTECTVARAESEMRAVSGEGDSEAGLGKKVKVAYTQPLSVGLQSWSRFLAVGLQATRVINLAGGCHYFPPGLQLPSQSLRWLLPVPILLLGEQRHDGCKQFA